MLILTTFGLDQYIIEALRAGASGFLLTDAPTHEVIAAVRAVAAGDAVLSAAVTRQLLDQVARRLPAAISQQPEELKQLTERERGLVTAGRGSPTASPSTRRRNAEPRDGRWCVTYT